MAYLVYSVDGSRRRQPLAEEELGDLTVAQVRKRAAELTSGTEERIALLYCGRLLKEDEKKLAQEGVKKGSNVHVIR